MSFFFKFRLISRSYIKSKHEKKRRATRTTTTTSANGNDAFYDDVLEKDSEDAQMFKSIRAMMIETSSGGSGGGASNMTSIEEDINNDDGLDQHGDDSMGNGLGDYDDDELPSNLIVTGLPNELFSSVELKRQFESMFTSRFALDNHDHSSTCRFAYFRLLKRCCVQFEEPVVAVLARLELDRVLFMGTQLKMYLNKVKLFLFVYSYFLLFFLEHSSFSISLSLKNNSKFAKVNIMIIIV